MYKRLVAGLSRLVTCLQSDFIGTNFAGFCSNLGARGLFSSPFVSYWAHIDWLAPGYRMGAENPTISWETETQVRATCQPRQPHRKHKTWLRFRTVESGRQKWGSPSPSVVVCQQNRWTFSLRKLQKF